MTSSLSNSRGCKCTPLHLPAGAHGRICTVRACGQSSRVLYEHVAMCLSVLYEHTVVVAAANGGHGSTPDWSDLRHDQVLCRHRTQCDTHSQYLYRRHHQGRHVNQRRLGTCTRTRLHLLVLHVVLELVHVSQV